MAALFDLSRTRQALLSVAQPALGAFIALGAAPPPRAIVLGGVAAAAGYLAVFSLNDLLDLPEDRRALTFGKGDWDGWDMDTAFMRHPVAAGRLPLTHAIAWVAVLSAVAGAAALALHPACLALFAASALLEALYCSLRRVTWLKTLVSGVMVGLGALAGWVAVAPLSAHAAAFFALVALWEVAGRNLPNDLADLAADGPSGLRTVATVFGPRASAVAIALGVAGAFAAVAALPAPPSWRLGVGAALGWSAALPLSALLASPSPDSGARYFNRASLFPALAFAAVALLATAA